MYLFLKTSSWKKPYVGTFLDELMLRDGKQFLQSCPSLKMIDLRKPQRADVLFCNNFPGGRIIWGEDSHWGNQSRALEECRYWVSLKKAILIIGNVNLIRGPSWNISICADIGCAWYSCTLVKMWGELKNVYAEKVNRLAPLERFCFWAKTKTTLVHAFLLWEVHLTYFCWIAILYKTKTDILIFCILVCTFFLSSVWGYHV